MHTITTHDAPATPLRAVADTSWHHRARCHSLAYQEADRLFFPKPRDRAAIVQARALCARCPVREACFNYALDNGLREGIWGGLTEAERRPRHAKVAHRLDYTRVRAVFAGRDVHLSDAERATVTRHAYVRGWNPEHLAHTLRIDPEWARDLLRKAAQDIADRDRYTDLTDDAEAPAADSSPVPGQVQTGALIAAFGKAA
ncbi:WhiB family transcriptional regulator [Streptomyces sp. DSM 42041]|uniref:Transcriptional regulator WhiB n=1 Tax=Streptomyces hazeniae TaxID=3075538 RepID=A0ABU2P022_9ACTN|nr:WhiB family transcriptional regulator [Streptomyces sp. DSM 42041]MDT0382587.1 WhiB family transcriptional regulator [Streptomyces sp. DSM 42041]